MKDMTARSSAKTQACTSLPNFERLNFYFGQALGVADFQTEQSYFREKLRLHNRCFHGYGIVCGLEVEPLPSQEDCDTGIHRQRGEMEEAVAAIDGEIERLQPPQKQEEKDENAQPKLKQLQSEKESLQRRLEQLPDCYPRDEPVPAQILVNCGWAVDCEGREIIVHQPQRLDLWSLLSAEQMGQIRQNHKARCNDILVELALCYCEQPTYPSRPMMTDACAPVSKCVYGRTQESFKFHISLTPLEPDKRCNNCCETCENCCVVLAHIHWDPTRSITLQDIDWRPRHGLSLYQATVITGISWVHGATYTSDKAKDVLGTKRYSSSGSGRTDGIEVTFSKPVYAETLQPGVVDILCYRGGSGLRGAITHIEGSFVDKPDAGLINSFKYRDDSGEHLDRGDRILILIRGNFILDSCCRPIDAEHVGGLVPQLENYRNQDIAPCNLPPTLPCAEARHQLWTSGNSRPGGNFESWFFIE